MAMNPDNAGLLPWQIKETIAHVKQWAPNAESKPHVDCILSLLDVALKQSRTPLATSQEVSHQIAEDAFFKGHRTNPEDWRGNLALAVDALQPLASPSVDAMRLALDALRAPGIDARTAAGNAIAALKSALGGDK
jgi:hypothetical protein